MSFPTLFKDVKPHEAATFSDRLEDLILSVN